MLLLLGNDVWIAENCVIMSGLTIGHGAIVGASSVVRESIPPYAIVIGNPAYVVGYRHTTEQIIKLLDINWFLWDDDQLYEAMPYLLHDDVNQFIDRYWVNLN